jgi:hypothetical protein
MARHPRLFLVSTSAALVAFSLSFGVAQAQAEAQPAPKSFESSVGAKLFLGGNIWTTPDDVPGGYDGLGFAAEGGGFGWGGALYYEARIVQHLGLELDLGYDTSTLLRNVTQNGFDTQEKVTHSGPRIGLLVKGIVPAPFGRLWAGLGPELMIASSADATLEVEGTEQSGAIEAEKKSSTMLAFALGMVFHVGDAIEIPVELRAAKNLTQESKWTDRVDIPPTGTGDPYTVTAQNSWDFRLGVGGGYRF